ncbi:uracil-DNA glycosylase family protein [Sphingobacterium chuzhouense]|uniref:Uracil-DNA glycosylase family protein n=1 Tax=Sphingobacterium chuzhouense TaxID=1742264 RepID=A0ABR7XY34_9SPHI|nr:uracil-DNA glycosylase family protein [Sphingobacterium chuzhouense]MBD1423943.1 uracil-DNA glycosylase family protein [Sphingobacterium chuzhouense]
MNQETEALYREIKRCRICEPKLLAGVNPVLTIDDRSKILIVGQAPGMKVHLSGIPWDDQSGKELRNWLGVTEEAFYNPENFAIIPMGFCYPGKSKSGDLPPRVECAPIWHERVLAQMQNIKLTLLIGQYAQSYYLRGRKHKTLTETVKNYRDYLPTYFPLPHPSPRNFIWMSKNQWFKEETVPVLRDLVNQLLQEI